MGNECMHSEVRRVQVYPNLVVSRLLCLAIFLFRVSLHSSSE